MSKLIDTNIAVFLTEGSQEIASRVATFDHVPAIALLTVVELEGGVLVKPEFAVLRRERLDTFLARVRVLPFDVDTVSVYSTIVKACGFSRPRVLDRLIAATAIVHDLALVTSDGDDFREIPGLKLEVWPRPAQ